MQLGGQRQIVAVIELQRKKKTKWKKVFAHVYQSVPSSFKYVNSTQSETILGDSLSDLCKCVHATFTLKKLTSDLIWILGQCMLLS